MRIYVFFGLLPTISKLKRDNSKFFNDERSVHVCCHTGINWLFVYYHFFDYYLPVRLGVESNWNLFEIRSIRKFAIRLIRKSKKYSKNLMKINSKFVRFDLTPTIGWCQIFRCRIRATFDRFDSKIYDSIDSKGEKKFEKFDKNQFEIRSIRFDSTSRRRRRRTAAESLPSRRSTYLIGVHWTAFYKYWILSKRIKPNNRKTAFFSPSSAPITNEITIIRQGGTDGFTSASSPIYKRALLSYEKRCFLYSVRCCVLPIFQNFMIAIS